MTDKKDYAPTIIRVLAGLLMLLPGLSKLMNPSKIIGMLGSLGFPAAGAFGWILIFSEVVFGAAVLVGWKVRYTVWPLVVILAVATLTVHIPSIGENPMALINILFHLLGMGALISVYLSGPGALAIDKE